MRTIILVVALASIACGAAPAPQASMAQAAPAPEAPEATAPVADAAPNTEQSLVSWQNQFDEALADTDRLDCPNACRALHSLERSAAHICGVVGAHHTTCRDVEDRRVSAQAKVLQRCGVCPP